MGETRRTIVTLEEALAAAIVAGDAELAGAYLTEDWAIVSAEGTVVDRETFLAAIESGALCHEAMEFDDWAVRVHGDCVVATCEARSSGTFHDEPFETHERSTSIYVRQDDGWACAFTQLTALSPGNEDD